MAIDFSQIPSPCYVLEEKLLRKNLELINRVQTESGAEIILALKGFSMYKMFPMVKKYLSGATASSLNEARLIFEEMDCLAHTYAPAYKPEEFEELMGYSSHITFNSLNQFHQFKGQVDAFDRKISMGLRINPQYAEVSTDMYNPCVVGSRLGITREALGDSLPDGIEGLHSHTMCENDSYVLERTLVHIEEKFGDLLHQIKWLNLGGGHLMTKEGYDHAHLIATIKRLKATYNIDIILEPGSAIAWQTGYLRSRVLDIVDAQGVDVAILDISFAAHMPDTLEMPYKPKVWGATDAIEGKPTYRLGGMTCLAGDYMSEYSFDKPLEIGDTVIFDDMIHYTMVKTTTFNGVGLPSIGIWHEDDTFELVKSFGFESFKEKI
ncbi:carboxynorspermidine decarboxylase [Lacihabitans soyangensis]|uniref:Carboxynorspermidine/carboxyspermidine decarboxylase n=1 Tax=Lacihabitans soyangensis TaxID=869394 RepID=A0AAE3GXX4_9BACT|nr:carboxynorspermidine decarboxylase [Lacihabitans soyangensis]MCP9761329.1 carboxynorspermidine decarboxylase [Lacihabitans soyangensis]